MNRVLVDTHALLWWLSDDAALSPPARETLADPASEPLVSAASVWEIAIKRSLGKLTAPDDLPDLIVDEGFSWLPITALHAWHVRGLPMHHRDPFDRLLVAQAITEQLPVITADTRFTGYGVEVRW
ncbi:MAG TPA: type II toxin-antitoxin system VapC family toxin [Solirubrobacteraceae bacterium]|nr:type II toxin-antitoxin system VapC family toxin [Solirubrobacteraceae bacterium]